MLEYTKAETNSQGQSSELANIPECCHYVMSWERLGTMIVVETCNHLHKGVNAKPTRLGKIIEILGACLHYDCRDVVLLALKC